MQWWQLAVLVVTIHFFGYMDGRASMKRLVKQFADLMASNKTEAGAPDPISLDEVKITIGNDSVPFWTALGLAPEQAVAYMKARLAGSDRGKA